MPGRHSLKTRRVERAAHRRATELVDAHTGQAHLLTEDAVAAGQLPKGRYIAICGQEVLPVALPEPESGYYPSCFARSQTALSIPAQRSRAS